MARFPEVQGDYAQAWKIRLETDSSSGQCQMAKINMVITGMRIEDCDFILYVEIFS